MSSSRVLEAAIQKQTTSVLISVLHHTDDTFNVVAKLTLVLGRPPEGHEASLPTPRSAVNIHFLTRLIPDCVICILNQWQEKVAPYA